MGSRGPEVQQKIFGMGVVRSLVCVYLVLEREREKHLFTVTDCPRTLELSFGMPTLYFLGMMIRSTVSDNNDTSDWTLP